MLDLLAWLAALSVSTSVSVVGFSDDGTRALLRKDHFSPEGGRRVGFVVVEAGKEHDELTVSDTQNRGDGYRIERVDNAACRDAVRLLERELASFSKALDVRLSACPKQGRVDLVIDVKEPAAPLASAEELAAVRGEIGESGGRVFVNERGPLVVVLLANPNDFTGRGVLVRTALRSDPRVIDRWPDPREPAQPSPSTWVPGGQR
jgi:hypothetical protein